MTRLPPHGLTVAEVARRLRVGEDKVRAWIAKGDLRAVNVASTRCGRPRWVVMPEALTAFEQSRTSQPPPPKITRRKKQTGIIDYFPD